MVAFYHDIIPRCNTPCGHPSPAGPDRVVGRARDGPSAAGFYGYQSRGLLAKPSRDPSGPNVSRGESCADKVAHRQRLDRPPVNHCAGDKALIDEQVVEVLGVEPLAPLTPLGPHRLHGGNGDRRRRPLVHRGDVVGLLDLGHVPGPLVDRALRLRDQLGAVHEDHAPLARLDRHLAQGRHDDGLTRAGGQDTQHALVLLPVAPDGTDGVGLVVAGGH